MESINSWEDDDWENVVIPDLTTSFKIELENRRKVEESDMENARDLFGVDLDKTLIEMEFINKEHNILSKPAREKRVLTEEEIEQRVEQEEIKKEQEKKKKKKKAQKQRLNQVFGEPEDNDYDRYADYESKYLDYK